MEVFTLHGLFTLQNLLAILTLSALEIVLGIDNVVFLAIVTGRLPRDQQPRAQRVGLLLAMIMRILLLLTLTLIMRLTTPLFTLALPNVMEGGSLTLAPSWKDLILIGGGVFLLAKATWEIHHSLEPEAESNAARAAASFAAALVQVVAIDIIFSLDSVITAVGMARDIRVMILAVIFAVAVMMAFAGKVSRFVQRHPTIKMLALSFLVLIGVMLIVDGFGVHVNKGYIYFAMSFSLAVELLNIRARKKHAAAKAAA